MKTVRIIASFLFLVTRFLAILVLLVTIYALAVVLLYENNSSTSLPMHVLDNGTFQIFYPFTRKVFLLGDYTFSYLLGNFFTIAFYGLFLWLLSGVFYAFKQQKLFTSQGVKRLSRFYIINLVVPIVFLGLIMFFGNEMIDLVRIILLHLVIGVFAYFMAAIFRQGLLLQEEQDLTF